LLATIKQIFPGEEPTTQQIRDKLREKFKNCAKRLKTTAKKQEK